MIDISIPSNKKKIKEEEEKFNNWKKEKGLKGDNFAKEKYLARVYGVIDFDENKMGASRITVLNPEKYSTLIEVFTALDSLQRGRSKHIEEDRQILESIKEEEFDKVNQ